MVDLETIENAHKWDEGTYKYLYPKRGAFYENLYMMASFVLLSLAMHNLPLGTAYTIWTGIGRVGAFLVGLFVLGEQVSMARIIAAILIVAGLILIKLDSSR
ncbi:hypothetical protein GCM10028818_52710 [Spirosoma horti]